MRKSGTLFAVMALAGMVLGGGSLALSAAPQIEEREVIRALIQGTGGVFVDVGPRGPSTGDYVVGSEDLLDIETGEAFGVGHFECTLHPQQAEICFASYEIFGRGQLSVQGVLGAPTEAQAGAWSSRYEARVRAPARSDGPPLAITGGTGEFINARGELHLGRPFTWYVIP